MSVAAGSGAKGSYTSQAVVLGRIEPAVGSKDATMG